MVTVIFVRVTSFPKKMVWVIFPLVLSTTVFNEENKWFIRGPNEAYSADRRCT